LIEAFTLVSVIEGNRPGPVRANYQMFDGYRETTIAICAVVAVLGCVGVAVMAVVAIYDDPEAWVFVVACPLLIAAAAYALLVRVAYRVDLDGDTLRWWTPLRSGEQPVAQLLAIRPSRLGRNIADLVFLDDSRVPVMTRRGFIPFAARVQAVAPTVDVRLRWSHRIVERLPGPTGYRAGGPS
jgi:hypothetical protein